MFVLRRAALRAISSKATTPSVIVPKTRTFITLAQSRGQAAQRCLVSLPQKRFASDEASETAATEAAANTSGDGETVAEVSAVAEEDVARTSAAEGPTDSSSYPASATSSEWAGAAAAGAAAAAAAPLATESSARPNPIPQYPKPIPDRTLYVGNIFFEVTNPMIEQYFSQFGPLKSAAIIYDSRGLNKGFAYVDFENLEDAQKAIEAAHQQNFEGRPLTVHFHRERSSPGRTPGGARPGINEPSRTLFIGNMSFKMSDKDLSDLFREVHNVVDVRIAIDRRTGAPRGFAHADFVDVASAQKAKELLDGKELYDRKLRIDYSVSTPYRMPR